MTIKKKIRSRVGVSLPRGERRFESTSQVTVVGTPSTLILEIQVQEPGVIALTWTSFVRTDGDIYPIQLAQGVT